MSVSFTLLVYIYMIVCINLLDLSLSSVSHKFGIILIVVHAIFPTATWDGLEAFLA